MPLPQHAMVRSTNLTGRKTSYDNYVMLYGATSRNNLTYLLAKEEASALFSV